MAMSFEIAQCRRCHSHSLRRAAVVRCCVLGGQLFRARDLTLAQRSEQEMPEFEDYATRADMAYLNSRLDALVMSSAPAGTTLSQMTMPPPRPLHPPLIVGGLPPPGYIFVGRHHHLWFRGHSPCVHDALASRRCSAGTCCGSVTAPRCFFVFSV